MQLLDAFRLYPSLFISTLLIAGLLVGSFLNVVIYRYPIMLFREWSQMAKEILTEQGFKVSGEAKDPNIKNEKFNIVFPRSRCSSCGHLIRSWENIPLISYLFQRGKCTQCAAHISLRYPFVELLTGLVFGYIAWRFGVSWQSLLYITLSSLLIVQIFIDIDHKILPDPINYIILWLGLSAAAFGLTIPLMDAFIGALVGYLSLWAFYWTFKILTKKEGMGYGDFKLLAALGAFVGYQKLLLVVIMSAGVGAIIGVSMILLKRSNRETQIPFGPYLAIAGWITLFWGDNILRQYFHSMGI
jgi:leader peptidase (prepilin peptidase)/N-methyltransferase